MPAWFVSLSGRKGRSNFYLVQVGHRRVRVACARGGDVARSCFLAAAEPYTLTINIKTILKNVIRTGLTTSTGFPLGAFSTSFLSCLPIPSLRRNAH